MTFLGLVTGFSDTIPKSQITKENVDKLELLKLKTVVLLTVPSVK